MNEGAGLVAGVDRRSMLEQLASETAETMQLMRTCVNVPEMTPDDSLFSAATKLHASWQQNTEKKTLQERQLETLDTSMEFLRSQLAKANSTLEELLNERDNLRKVSRKCSPQQKGRRRVAADVASF